MPKTKDQTKAGWIKSQLPAQFHNVAGLEKLSQDELWKLHTAIHEYGSHRIWLEREWMRMTGMSLEREPSFALPYGMNPAGIAKKLLNVTKTISPVCEIRDGKIVMVKSEDGKENNK